MNPASKIWVALDCKKQLALDIAEAVGSHPSIFGFKVNRLVDQEVFRQDGEPKLFEALKKRVNKPIWVDLKFHDVPRTVVGRMESYLESECVEFMTVHADGGMDMIMDAVEEADCYDVNIIAVTKLTSLSEEEVHLQSGQPSKAAVINLARMAMLAGVKYLVCSGQELKVLEARRELTSLAKFVPGITPDWKVRDAPDQKRVTTPYQAISNGATALVIGSAIVGADDPLDAVKKTAAEIAAAQWGTGVK